MQSTAQAAVSSSPARPRWQSLLTRTLLRLQIATLARRALVVLLALAAAYGLLILFTRLTGLAGQVMRVGSVPIVLACLPLVALAIASLIPRRPSLRDAARAVDRHARTEDLFLTMVMLDKAFGEFQPLVAAKAETAAAKIQSRQVVPLGVNRRLTLFATVLVACIALVQFVPQLDPFGKVDAAQQAAKETRKLDETKKATKERLAQIERENLSDAESKEVKQALDKLKTAVGGAQPKAKQVNAQALAASQKNLNEQWRKLSADKLRELMSQSSMSMAQQFGSSSSAESKKWLDELQAGSTESLKKEMTALQQDLEQLAKTKDPGKRAQLQKQIRERLDALAEFAKEKTGSKSLAAAIKRGQEQMRMACKACDADKSAAMQEALQAAADSMKLANKELEQIAQSAKELKELEKAMEVLQMAKKLNNSESLDGGKCKNCKSMADYEAMFAEMMKGQAQAQEGMGDGSTRDEDDSKTSKFKTEISKSQIGKGKVLLTLKTKGMGEHVDVKEQYRSAIRGVKQGVSEAILQEEIPPGYHEAIKGYFDTLEEKPAGK